VPAYRGRIGIGLMTLVAMLAWMPGSAAASNGVSGGLKYVSVSRQENGGAATFGEQAECGLRQWVATGGGAKITGVALGHDRWVIGTEVGLKDVGFPRRPDMIETAFNAAHSRAPATISAYAVCKKRSSPGSTFTSKPNGFDYSSGGLTYVHREGDISGNSSATINASCGDQALTGGTALAFLDHGFLNTSQPLDEPTDNDLVRDDAWRGFFHNVDALGASTQAEAICAAPNSAFAQALDYKQSQPTTELVGQVKSATAACGTGQVVTGGGVFVSGPVSEAAVTGTAPADLRDLDTIPDDGWRGTVANLSGGTKTVTAYAICKQT
jgi:hypothetical protein